MSIIAIAVLLHCSNGTTLERQSILNPSIYVFCYWLCSIIMLNTVCCFVFVFKFFLGGLGYHLCIQNLLSIEYCCGWYKQVFSSKLLCLVYTVGTLLMDSLFSVQWTTSMQKVLSYMNLHNPLPHETSILRTIQLDLIPKHVWLE